METNAKYFRWAKDRRLELACAAFFLLSIAQTGIAYMAISAADEQRKVAEAATNEINYANARVGLGLSLTREAVNGTSYWRGQAMICREQLRSQDRRASLQ